jgi:hypothetical protein
LYLPRSAEQLFGLASDNQLPEDFFASVSVRSHGLSSFSRADDGTALDAERFADRYSPRIRVINDSVLIALHGLSLSSGDPSRLTMSQGVYDLSVEDCSFGWWLEAPATILAPGQTVIFSAYETSLARLLPNEVHGGASAEDVVMVYERVSGSVVTRYEGEVPWVQDGERLSVSLTGDILKSTSDYVWIKVKWSDGSASVTQRYPSPMGLVGVLSLEN